jgi:hypothetical protein
LVDDGVLSIQVSSFPAAIRRQHRDVASIFRAENSWSGVLIAGWLTGFPFRRRRKEDQRIKK